MERDEVTISAYKLALRESQSANLTKDARIAKLEAELAEARMDSERLAWAWANPDKFLEAQGSTPPDKTGRDQIDAARKEGA